MAGIKAIFGNARVYVCAAAVIALVGIPSTESSAGVASVWALDDGQKIKFDDVSNPLETVTLPYGIRSAVDAVTLHGARNEMVGFQLIVEAGSAGAVNVDACVSDLVSGASVIEGSPWNGGSPGSCPDTSYSGLTRPSAQYSPFDYTDARRGNVELFVEQYTRVAYLSSARSNRISEKTDLHFIGRNYPYKGASEMFTGLIPDALVPFCAKPVPAPISTTVPQAGGAPFQIPASRNQGIWADLYIPKTAAAGVYTGKAYIYEDGVRVKGIAITLVVRNFALPDKSSFNAWSTEDPRAAPYRHGLTPDSTLPPVWNRIYTSEDARNLRRRYFQLAHRHRLEMYAYDYDAANFTVGSDHLAAISGALYAAGYQYAGPGENAGASFVPIGVYGILYNDDWKMDCAWDRYASFFQSNTAKKSQTLSTVPRTIGMKFTIPNHPETPINGKIFGVNFWQTAGGTTEYHYCGMWTTTGQLLATGRTWQSGIQNAHASGWVGCWFYDENRHSLVSVPVTRGQTYVVGYTAADARYPQSNSFPWGTDESVVSQGEFIEPYRDSQSAYVPAVFSGQSNTSCSDDADCAIAGQPAGKCLKRDDLPSVTTGLCLNFPNGSHTTNYWVTPLYIHERWGETCDESDAIPFRTGISATVSNIRAANPSATIVKYAYPDEGNLNTTNAWRNYPKVTLQRDWIHLPTPLENLSLFATGKFTTGCVISGSDASWVNAVDRMSVPADQTYYTSSAGCRGGMNAAETAGKTWGVYNGFSPFSGSAVVDTYATDPMSIPWVAFRFAPFGYDDFFYWNTTSWGYANSGPRKPLDVFTDLRHWRKGHEYNGVSYGDGNGDGLWIYPGRDIDFPGSDKGVDGPIASIRLKAFRRGMQDYEYLRKANRQDPKNGIDPSVLNVLNNETRESANRGLSPSSTDVGCLPKALWEVGAESSLTRATPPWPIYGADFEKCRDTLANLIPDEPLVDNLVVNGEVNGSNGWAFYRGAAYDAAETASPGSGSLDISAGTPPYASSGYFAQVQQAGKFPVTPGKTITVTCFIKTELAPVGLYGLISRYDSNGTYRSNYSVPITPPAQANTWTRYTTRYTVGANEHYIKLIVGRKPAILYANNFGKVWVDNIMATSN